jgi:hypothetical protein
MTWLHFAQHIKCCGAVNLQREFDCFNGQLLITDTRSGSIQLLVLLLLLLLRWASRCCTSG